MRAPAAPAKVALEESIDVQFSASPVPVSPAPREVEPEPRQEVLELLDEAATTIDAPVAPAPARARDRARLMSADVSCARSDVDDLLARFGVSSLVTPETMQSTRASLKRLAGLDPTPPPPSAAELRKLTARPPRVELFRMRESQREEVLATLPDRAALRPTTVALVALGLVLAGLLGHYLPPWLEQLTATSVDTAP